METAPFFLTFSALVLIMTAALVFPAMGKWISTMERERAVKETLNLEKGISNVLEMGDAGTIDQMEVNLPRGYEIDVNDEGDFLMLMRNGENIRAFPVENADLTYYGDKISGYSRITIANWDEEIEGREYVIRVTKK
jgi:hypothetical protein